jgi:hypothetical protein
VKPAIFHINKADALISTNERVMVVARTKYYENANNKKKVQTGQYVGE